MYVFIIKYIAKISLKDFFTKITEVWLVAFSTTSSSGTLPVSLHVTEEKFKVKDELAKTKDYQGVSGSITLDEKHNAVKGVVIIEMKNGIQAFKEKIKPLS